jgi:hypothetical protein
MLDCDTEKGKVFIKYQRETQRIIEAIGYRIIEMPQKDSNSDIIISKNIGGNETICGIGEIKCREKAGNVMLTRNYLKQGGYLITNEKLLHGQKISELLKTPFYIIVNLLSEKVILIWKITNEAGIFQFQYVTKESKTQSTCNGGIANRVNAYLPLSFAKEIIY